MSRWVIIRQNFSSFHFRSVPNLRYKDKYFRAPLTLDSAVVETFEGAYPTFAFRRGLIRAGLMVPHKIGRDDTEDLEGKGYFKKRHFTEIG